MQSKAAQTTPKKLIRRTCPSGHGSDGSGPKWHTPPCFESAALGLDKLIAERDSVDAHLSSTGTEMMDISSIQENA